MDFISFFICHLGKTFTIILRTFAISMAIFPEAELVIVAKKYTKSVVTSSARSVIIEKK